MAKKSENIVLENREMPELAVRALIVPGSIDLEKRTIRVEYTTGAQVYRRSYFEEDYYEELSLEKGHVRLDRLNNGSAPVLNSHKNYDLSDVMGAVLEGDERFATLKFSERAEVEGYWKDIVAGIIRSVSVGYMVYRYQDVTPEGNKVKVLRAIDWAPFEISMVAVPADAGAGVRSNVTSRCVVIGNRSETQEKGQKPMSKTVDTNNPAPAPVETETRAAPAAVAAPALTQADIDNAVAAEMSRQNEIRTMVRTFGLEEKTATDLIDKKSTVDAARKAVMDELAARSDEAPINPRVKQIRAAETRNEAIENAIMHRANPGSIQLTEQAQDYRGMGLLDICRELVGYQESRGLNKRQLVERAFHSTSDFSGILANIASKTLRKAYTDTVRSFQPFARQVFLPDFKEVKRMALSNGPSLKLVVEGGEYEAGTFTEGAEAYSLFTYGRTFMITRQAIINDDLDAFTRIPAKMAAAAARLENRMVYDILLNNPVMGDGVALFNAAHGNLINNLLNVNGLGAMRKNLRVQKDPSAEDVLNYTMKYLVVPAALEVPAAQLQGQFVATKTSDINPLQNSFSIITEGYLDSVDPVSYYGIADPSEADGIEYAYLEGENGPYVETRESFNSDGMEIKVRHDFAAKAIDWRSMVKSTNNGS